MNNFLARYLALSLQLWSGIELFIFTLIFCLYELPAVYIPFPIILHSKFCILHFPTGFT
ncbi:MAG: hypothetical protein IPJ03_09565 [Ignavibacteriales bacterium]|nr:hypothetical protein [Ignavibacteriales bacterium]